MKLRNLLFVFGLTAVLSAATPAEPTKNYQHVRDEHSAAIKAGTPVKVVNHYGDIRTRPATANTVEMVSHNQFQNTPKPQLNIVNEKDKLLIEVIFPEAKGDVTGKKIQRVDLTLFIPENSPLTIHGKHGLVEVKGHAARLEIEADRGHVRFKNKAETLVKTVQGDIKGNFKGKPAGKSHIESIHGTIDLRFADKAAYKVKAVTKGHITSDYTMNVDWKGRERLKHAELETGNAGAELMVDSRHGNVMLLREI
ncbi:DUF4097 family beta strand repeat-containing protein [Acanthopleuribacter pedis]|uniref:DUF4097 family beta strand repeat protein n=1 Tax=Acanthopleuribacter pedis TaxID=442870 RepID=A0A8J7U0M3_9BACT|nr:DUF4097 family beta strand repeat-containing protein [Acanthopleuribacter pedis]MBO1317223.1 DUF4097 family beta strand repeat protein [Acanthopleuribacter pedis]MBO1318529.1 DUF4097 family beta strand repeat protein [Acanthopleuribacter pedis]